MEKESFVEILMDASLFLQPGNIFAAKYKILSFISQGGMGAVYKAEEIGTNKIVAIKIMLNQTSVVTNKRFLREIRLAAQLQHPNIVRTVTADKMGDQVYMVMEYLDGLSLDSYVRDNKLDLNAKLQLIYKIALALDYAHGRKIIHRDIKPANILVTKEGIPKIMDFGLAKVIANKEYELTKTGEIMGTPRYMSPEQVSGKNSVDKTTDIYALGAILYEVVTDKEMIGGDSFIEIFYNIKHKRPHTLPKNISKMVEDIWWKSTAPKYNRYKTAALFAKDIKIFLEQKQFSLTQRIVRKHSYNIIGIFLLLLVITCFALILKIERNADIAEDKSKEGQLKIVQNLLELELYEEAEQKFKTLLAKSETSDKEIAILQLKIWEGKGEYGKIWDSPLEATKEVALLKIKSGYYLDKDLFHEETLTNYITSIEKSNETKQQAELLFYRLLYTYYKKKYEIEKTRNEDFIKYYESCKIDVELLKEKQQWELSLCLGDAYLHLAKEVQEADKIDTYAKKAAEVYRKMREKGDTFEVLKGLAASLLIQKDIKSDKISEARQCLRTCTTIRPGDWKVYLMLAETYEYEKKTPYLAYTHFGKALLLAKSSVEPTEQILRFGLENTRYQDELFWMLYSYISNRFEQEKPDLLHTDIEAIKKEYEEKYIEYQTNKDKTVNRSVFYKKLNNKEFYDTAKKALIMSAYNDNSPLESIDPEIKDVLENIKEKISQNQKDLLYYLLAEFYLYSSFEIKEELEKRVEDIKEILFSNKEPVLIRYLATKALVATGHWQTLIHGLKYIGDLDLMLVCHRALQEAGMTFALDNLFNEEFVDNINTYERVFFLANMIMFDNSFYNEYVLTVKNTPLNEILLRIDCNFTEEEEEKARMECFLAAAVCQNTDKDSEWETKAPILQMMLQQKQKKLDVYAHHCYWNSYKLLNYNLDQDIRPLKDYIEILGSDYFSPEVKLAMLNAKHFYESPEVVKALKKNPEIKNLFIRNLKNLMLNSNYVPLSLKSAYAISSIAPFEKEFVEIVQNQNLSPIYRMVSYVNGKFRYYKLYFGIQERKSILETPEVKSILQDPGFLIEKVKNQILVVNFIMQREDSEVFKNAVYKLYTLFDLKTAAYFDLPCTNDDLRANMLISINGQTLMPQILTKFLENVAKNYDYKPFERPEQNEKVNKSINAKTKNLKMSAWAAKIFLNKSKVQEMIDEAQNERESVKQAGIALGLYLSIQREVMKDKLSQDFQKLQYLPFYELYLTNLLEKAKNKELAKKYLFYLESAEKLDNDPIYKAQYQYEQASIYWEIMQDYDRARIYIDKAIASLENFKNDMAETIYLYQLTKIKLINDENEKYEILANILARTNQYYLLKKVAKTIENNISHKEADEKWRNLYTKSLKKWFIATNKASKINANFRDFFREESASIYAQLEKYSDMEEKEFYHDNKAILEKILQKK